LGFTLDQLLETTGVGSLSGRDLEKIAAKKGGHDLLKLAERCRRAADAPDEVPAGIDERDLVEKTAAVMVIQRTLSEIREIEGRAGVTKTASATSHQATFIKAALEAGHDPESIARFLDQPPGSRPTPPEVRKKKSATSIIG